MNITKKQITDFLKSEKFRIIFLVIIATLIRLYKLSKEVFWTDEGSYVGFAFHDNLPVVIQAARVHDHPPFYFFFYNFWGKIFGISQIALISFSIIVGVISIILIYFLVKKLFKNRDVAFISALLTCFSLFHFHYSRDATEYMFFPMIIFLSLLTFIMFLESKPEHRIRNALFYLVSTTALFYTHNYAFMIILVQNIAFFIFFKKHKNLIKYWIIIQIILLLLISPGLSYTYTDANTYADMYGEGLTKSLTLKGYGKTLNQQIKTIYIYNTGDILLVSNTYFKQHNLAVILSKIIFTIINLSIILGILLSLINIRQAKKKNKKKKINIKINKENLFGVILLLLLFLIPLSLTSFFPLLFRSKCFVFTVLSFNTFLALCICSLSKKRIIRILLIVIFLIIGFMNITHSMDNNYFFGEQENWKGVAEFLKQPEQKAELIVIHVNYNLIPFLYHYNFNLVDDVAKGKYYPLDSSKSNLIIIDPIFTGNFTGKLYVPRYDKINKSLQQINDFWLVSSGHANHVYPEKEIFNFIEDNFENVSEHYFGSVYATRYKRR